MPLNLGFLKAADSILTIDLRWSFKYASYKICLYFFESNLAFYFSFAEVAGDAEQKETEVEDQDVS